MWTNAHGV